MLLLRALLLSAFALMTLAACSDADSTSPTSSSSSSSSGAVPAGPPGSQAVACSTTPYQAAFPTPRDAAGDHQALPECPARCGAEKATGAPYNPSYAIEDLPAGACSVEGYRCRIGAGTTQTCPDTPRRLCSMSEVACDCAGGTWRCFVTSQGAGVCTPCSDAGPTP